ncbi:MAG TPA: chemotaxis protein CheW [Noviherbaspirillum sp.]
MNEEQAPIDDCWNRTGIHGDRSCERLQEHGHCRHCEVYASAATRLMQRPMPPDYRAAWTRHFAEPEAVERAADESVLVFRVGQEWLTLPARHAILVAEEGKPHRLPHRRGNELHGIVNVRGRLYPCMSLSSLLQIDEHAPAANATANRHQSGSRILVVELGGMAYALPVQEVHGIHRYRHDELQAVPATLSHEAQRYLRGVLHVGAMAAGCLDAELLAQHLAGALK